MELIIAEKPSVAEQIAKIMGATEKNQGYFEGNNYLVSWCVGHLVALAPAEIYNSEYEKWKLEDLPIIPENFQYVPTEGKEQQLKTLSNLLHRGDVDLVINACDSGREGELIFRLVYDYANCKKPIKRLWISSMEDVAIREGFSQLKEGKDMDYLYQSALTRAKADWLIGINATRLFSCLYKQTLNVGRVISPTLTMVATRNEEITLFKPTPFYYALLECGGFSFTSPRFPTKKEANSLVALAKTEEISVKSVEKKERTQLTPQLYDLTTLQREANRKLGFSAQQTLTYLQSLYEKKIVTYPRTDSNYITPDMEETLFQVVDIAMDVLKLDCEPPTNTQNVIDSKKVTDHHAIIPTLSLAKMTLENLPYGEREILTLVLYRTLQAVSEVYRYEETVVTVEFGGEILSTSGQTVVNQGYKVFDKSASTTGDKILPKTLEGNKLQVTNSSVKEGKTTPPRQYTEDTILYAMEHCTENQGIGTAATRAKALEKLVEVQMLERKGEDKTKFLVPTAKGHALATVLPDSVKSPTTTAEWEMKLAEIEKGTLSPEVFMEEIKETLHKLVATYQVTKEKESNFPSQYQTIGTCPRCGKDVVEYPKLFACQDQECAFALWKNNRFFTSKRKQLTQKVAKDLLTTGKTKLTGCYSEKTGNKYDCTVILDKGEGKVVNFKMEFENKEKK